MNSTLGKHVIIDFYNCSAPIDTIDCLHEAMNRAFSLGGLSLDDISYHQSDEELIAVAVACNTHICMHAYPELGYVAADIYCFDCDLSPSQIMKVLKSAIGSDRAKATSVRRGDFGSLRDMKPKSKTSITPIRRMKNTGRQLKNTSVKVFHLLKRRPRIK